MFNSTHLISSLELYKKLSLSDWRFKMCKWNQLSKERHLNMDILYSSQTPWWFYKPSGILLHLLS